MSFNSIVDHHKIDHYIAAIRCNCGKRTLYDFGIRRCEDLGKVELDPDTFWKLVKIARSIRKQHKETTTLEYRLYPIPNHTFPRDETT